MAENCKDCLFYELKTDGTFCKCYSGVNTSLAVLCKKYKEDKSINSLEEFQKVVEAENEEYYSKISCQKIQNEDTLLLVHADTEKTVTINHVPVGCGPDDIILLELYDVEVTALCDILNELIKTW